MYRQYVPGTIEELEEKIRKAQKNHEAMKRINAYYRKHKTLDGCPDVDDTNAAKIKKSLSCSPGKPFSGEKIRYSLNCIKESEQRLLRETALRDAGDGWTFNGGRIVIDQESGKIKLCDSSDEIHRRIQELGTCFYWTDPDGTPQMMYFEHVLPELLEMTRKYDELYPKTNL